MKSKKCSCGKTIYFLKTVTGKTMPVTEDQLHEDELSALDNGIDVDFDRSRHISHFADCPDAKTFRRKVG